MNPLAPSQSTIESLRKLVRDVSVVQARQYFGDEGVALDDRYRLDGHLASGGTAEVYVARDLRAAATAKAKEQGETLTAVIERALAEYLDALLACGHPDRGYSECPECSGSWGAAAPADSS